MPLVATFSLGAQMMPSRHFIAPTSTLLFLSHPSHTCQSFLELNSLSLIIRSHEGPDARDRRTDLGQVLTGYAIDHVTPGRRARMCGTYEEMMAPNYRNAVSVKEGCPI